MEWTPRKRAIAGTARRLASGGWSAGDIARICDLTRADVRAILAPRPPRPARPPRPGRVRSEWPRCNDADDDPPSGEPEGGEWRAKTGPPSSPLATRHSPLQDAAAPCGAWGSMRASSAIGGSSPNAALSDAEAALIRELRARGVPRRDVADRFGVSVATVTRITRGDTYRAAGPEPDRVVPELPAIAAAHPVEPATWTEPKRRGRDWRDD